MKIGYIGLGKMGLNMVERLIEKNHQVTAFDRSAAAVQAAAKQGAQGSSSIEDLAVALEPPRVVWLMVPYFAVDPVLREIVPLFEKGDLVIDGGNSPYKDSIRRAGELEGRGIDFLDAGVSGGPKGARNGACIMVGGRREAFEKAEALLRDLAADEALLYTGPSGSGHFVKMVHNGIEYGMMQALAEGFTVLKASPFPLDLAKIADLYDHQSVIESRLVDWLRHAFERSGDDLQGITGATAQSGEGMWTVEAAREFGVDVPIIRSSVEFRLESQKRPNYAGKVLSALRNEFGGHDAAEKNKP
jgi:6-phosphogluconate dehydrogenase